MTKVDMFSAVTYPCCPSEHWHHREDHSCSWAQVWGASLNRSLHWTISISPLVELCQNKANSLHFEQQGTAKRQYSYRYRFVFAILSIKLEKNCWYNFLSFSLNYWLKSQRLSYLLAHAPLSLVRSLRRALQCCHTTPCWLEICFCQLRYLLFSLLTRFR